MTVENLKDEAFTQAVESGSKLIVKYYAGWCGNCRLLAPKFKRLAADGPEDVRFLEVDAEKNPQARQLAGVDNLPFIAVFKDGKLQSGTATSRIEKVEEMLSSLN